MKKCSECKESKSLSLFNKNKAKSDGHANVCRRCMKVLRKNHYLQNKEKVFQAVVDRRQDLRDKLWEYKCAHPCVDCGETDARMLEFDHLPEHTKEFNISEMIARGFSWSKVIKEIEKCEVVCANHHRVRTHMRAGWARNVMITA